ncbi:MAG: 2-hydroxyacid dehydrogenase [Saprospiraceae bacterium]
MKITLFSDHPFERQHIEQANAGRHELMYVPTYLTPKTAILAKGSDAVAIFVNDNGSAEVLRLLHGYGVRYIACRSAGINHVDLQEAKALGMKVANVPGYSPYSIAEHTVALMLALNRKLVRANSRVRDLNFSLNGLTGFDMNGKTVGIVGVGAIGQVVAKILHGFGCHLLGFDLNPNEELTHRYGMAFTDLDDLIRRSDIITLHAPLNKHTQYLINGKRIAHMKKGVMLINTSRGGLVNTKAVIKGLKKGQIGYLGLDVYEEESGLFFEDHSGDILQDDVIARLLTFPNVLITSHQAFLTETALRNIEETTFHTINCWEKGEKSEFEL